MKRIYNLTMYNVQCIVRIVMLLAAEESIPALTDFPTPTVPVAAANPINNNGNGILLPPYRLMRSLTLSRMALFRFSISFTVASMVRYGRSVVLIH